MRTVLDQKLNSISSSECAPSSVWGCVEPRVSAQLLGCICWWLWSTSWLGRAGRVVLVDIRCLLLRKGERRLWGISRENKPRVVDILSESKLNPGNTHRCVCGGQNREMNWSYGFLSSSQVFFNWITIHTDDNNKGVWWEVSFLQRWMENLQCNGEVIARNSNGQW